MTSASPYLEGTQGPYRGIVDYILGITHEIWELREVEKILEYYSCDAQIFSLGGLLHGAAAVVESTRSTLQAFPDRLLIGDAVIWSRDGVGQFYSSHRITSPMTNLGASAFGPATGRFARVTTIADCLVEDGVIAKEWLVRDNLGLVRQLGLDPHVVARHAAARPLEAPFAAWLHSEHIRLRPRRDASVARTDAYSGSLASGFASAVLHNNWIAGEASAAAHHYAPYAVLHESSPVASGRIEIDKHYAAMRHAFAGAALSVDHLCVRSCDLDAQDVAVRWTLSARHVDTVWGLPATGQPLYLLGVTHWRVVAGKIAAEWTIFDRIAALAQLYRASAAEGARWR